MNVSIDTVNGLTTPENVVVSSVATGYQPYHGKVQLGHVALVYSVDNGGALRFLPPRITIDGEKFFVTGVEPQQGLKKYFRPFTDLDSPAEPDPIDLERFADDGGPVLELEDFFIIRVA